MPAAWIFFATALVWLAAAPLAAQPAEPFEGMGGSWTGTGTITLGTGDKERIRCRAEYRIENNGLHVVQDLRCASDSYKFEMVNELDYLNGQISGRWDEKTRRTGGSITGRARPGQIEAMAETGGFAALITLVTRGNQQTVKIDSKSPDISNVTITLRRAAR